MSFYKIVIDDQSHTSDAVLGAVGLGDYLEGASVVFLFTLAQWLEAKSSDKVKNNNMLKYVICLLKTLQN